MYITVGFWRLPGSVLGEYNPWCYLYNNMVLESPRDDMNIIHDLVYITVWFWKLPGSVLYEYNPWSYSYNNRVLDASVSGFNEDNRLCDLYNNTVLEAPRVCTI
jgi:hypothetical protein